MRRFVFLFSLVLGGCSFLFEPGRAPPPPCPISALSCPAKPNAIALCAASECSYTCSSGFYDEDGDLAARTGSNGCELACGDCAPPAPEYVEAEVGTISGTMRVTWPEVPASTSNAAHVATYNVSAGLQPGVFFNVVPISRATCVGGMCEAQFSSLADNTRVYVQVRSMDRFGNQSDPTTSPRTSATPLNGLGASTNGWDFNNGGCSSSFSSVGGTFQVQTAFLCLSAAFTGDSGWDTYTLDVDMKLGATAGGQVEMGGGIAFWSGTPATTELQSATVFSCASSGEIPTSIRRGFSEFASSVACVEMDQWYSLRLVVEGNLVSFQLGPAGGALHEVLRWRRTDGAAQGRIGLGGTGSAGLISFRQLRVRTRPHFPSDGPTATTLDFTGAFPGAMRIKADGAAQVEAASCPTLPGASGCALGECPAPLASCLHIVTGASAARASAGVDLPTGIDPSEDYSISFQFAAIGAATNPTILRTAQGLMLSSASWSSPLSWMGSSSGQTLAVGQWHLFQMRVQPSSHTASLSIDGGGLAEVALPSGWSTHLGPLIFGTLGDIPFFSSVGGPMEAYWSAVQITR